MRVEDLNYIYPEHLVATSPQPNFRTLLRAPTGELTELNKQQVLDLPLPGDLILINDTRVEKRRIFTDSGFEILFIEEITPNQWEVLCPASRLDLGEQIKLPGNCHLRLEKKGLPQIALVDGPLDQEFFETHGEFALPPYIQKARDERHNRFEDSKWYQTEWATYGGSSAAPTASLHFNAQDLDYWQGRKIKIAPLTLHVGLGTFLPVRTETLGQHPIHSESVFIPNATIEKINETKSNNGRVWAMGTTVTRALESWASGRLSKTNAGYAGETDLFIVPGYEFKVVDVLMTNFHQPKSTLLAMLASFVGLNEALSSYQWAIDRKFRLFSYGDLSIWQKK